MGRNRIGTPPFRVPSRKRLGTEFSSRVPSHPKLCPVPIGTGRNQDGTGKFPNFFRIVFNKIIYLEKKIMTLCVSKTQIN